MSGRRNRHFIPQENALNTPVDTLQTASSDLLDACRDAMAVEQAKSLSETDNWSHVDREKTHSDWAELYTKLAPLVTDLPPTASEVQALMTQHYAIISRFYAPTGRAYVGMALFYRENEAMRSFHNNFHPNMAAFVGEAMYAFARRALAL